MLSQINYGLEIWCDKFIIYLIRNLSTIYNTQKVRIINKKHII